MSNKVLKLGFFLIVVALIAAAYFKRSSDEVGGSSEPKQTTEIITTAKGAIEVGGSAFIDGRDTEAKPPLTLMSINVWDSFYRGRPVCSISHGAEVKVLSSHWQPSERRYYFKVSGANQCSGWVPETFVSPEYHATIGDRM